jgi:hypothetical protein
MMMLSARPVDVDPPSTEVTAVVGVAALLLVVTTLRQPRLEGASEAAYEGERDEATEGAIVRATLFDGLGEGGIEGGIGLSEAPSSLSSSSSSKAAAGSVPSAPSSEATSLSRRCVSGV